MEDMLVDILGKENVLKGELLSKHCTFGIGGKAYFYLTPTSFNKLLEAINFLNERKIKWKIIGNGSNLLFKDEGFKGAIICTLKLKEYCFLEDEKLLVSAGVMLPVLAKQLAETGLSGLEFASLIPASIGGALFMNAGAHGRCMADVVETITYFNGERFVVARVSDLMYSYRNSIFKNNPNFIILSCEIRLKRLDKHSILQEMEKIKNERKSSQPTGKSAGSVFLAKDGIPAWKFIDGCKLKGLSVGDAEISTKHANFIINKGKALSKDVLSLIELIKKKVNENYGKELELEIEVVD